MVRLKALEVEDFNGFGVRLQAIDRRFHHLEVPMVEFARIS